ncbi:MAG: hypothetical protein ACE5F4_01220 [Candidatus Paceibacteria bacterium]
MVKYIALAAIAILITFFFTLSGRNAFAPNEIPFSSEEGNNTSQSSDAVVFVGTMADLLSRGGTWRCTFSRTDGNATTRGTVYVDTERVRGDFESDVQGITLDSHLIVRDGSLYAWSPVTPGGIRAPYLLERSMEGDEHASLRETYTHECRAWTPNETVFELPDIEFISIDAPERQQ